MNINKFSKKHFFQGLVLITTAEIKFVYQNKLWVTINVGEKIKITDIQEYSKHFFNICFEYNGEVYSVGSDTIKNNCKVADESVELTKAAIKEIKQNNINYLNFTHNQLKKGQKLLIVKPLLGVRYIESEYSISHDTNYPSYTIPNGTVITLNKNINTCNDGINDYYVGIDKYNFHCKLPENEINLGDIYEYVIYYQGKRFKTKKFSDLGKIKASLMNMMDYHYKFHEESQKYLENCPENKGYAVEEWLSYGDNFKREDFEQVEIYRWKNKKLGDKDPFSAVDYFDELMLYIHVSAKYGSAARELFKKVKDTHGYMLVFMHEHYTLPNVYYEELKESETIKKIIKDLKIPNIKKSTKLGKTVIAVTDAADIVKIIDKLPENAKYFVLDMRGTELEKKNGRLFAREEKLKSILD